MDETTLTRDAARAGSSAAALMPTGKPSETPTPQSSAPTNATGVERAEHEQQQARRAPTTASTRTTGTRP